VPHSSSAVRRLDTLAVTRAVAFSITLTLGTSCGKKEDSPATKVTKLTYETPSNEVNAFFAANFPSVPSVADIGGYNDEQRLPGPGNDDYGAIVRLYVAPRAPTPTELSGGAIVGLLEVEGGNDQTAAAYTSLKIDNSSAQKLYCVYLQSSNSPGNPWDGFVTPVNGTTCTPIENKYKLQASEADGTETDDPYVARFVEDNAGLPAIGVGCLTAFCHLGQAVGNGHSPKADEQQLALPGAASGNSIPVHRGSAGRVTPVAGLGALKKANFQKGPQLVATVWLATAPDPTIKSKYVIWGLQQGDNGVWLALDAAGNWSAQFVPGTGAPTTQQPFVVSRPTDHTMPPVVPPNARWVWSDNDEEIWVACDQGCCTIGGITTDKGRGRGKN
jgi:hypothetical protein